MKKTALVLGVITFLSILSGAGAFSTERHNEIDQFKTIGVTGVHPIKIDMICKPVEFKTMGEDTQITFTDADEGHPSIDIDYNGNPLLVYHGIGEESYNIFIQRSPDGGKTWPEDMVLAWQSPDATYINPEVKFLEDGRHAYGTHETEEEMPFIYLHDYVDIDNPETWNMYYFDYSGVSTYVAETALCTNSTTTLAVGGILDYHGQGYDLEDTLLILWNTENGEGDWKGVFWINQDSEGNSYPYSHLSADAGVKMFFCYQQESTSGYSRIRVAYCKVNESTEYKDWRTSTVAAGSRYNCTYPDISVSGSKAYIVYMCDKNGNQDIYVAVSTTGRIWRKYPVVESPEDDFYPVISANGDKATCLFIRNGDLYKTTTEDGGVTWSTPELVNDVPGTAVEEYQYTDVKGVYGVWTDQRDGNDDIFFESVGLSPILTIEEISGGFGSVKAKLSNVGNAVAENTRWSIDVEGLVLLGAHSEGTITLPPGSSRVVKSKFLLGLGGVTVTVTFGDAVRTTQGFLLGPLLLGIKS